ncbi:putative FMN-binding split barrel [Helianthus debilis subsp. tardiflorus]
MKAVDVSKWNNQVKKQYQKAGSYTLTFSIGDSGQVHSKEDLKTNTHEVGHGGGTRAGLFRTLISGGVQSATSVNDLPKPAVAVRNLMEQVIHIWPGVLGLLTCLLLCHECTKEITDTMLSFSQLGIHTRHLLADPRCTLMVQIPGWSGLSNARATIIGDVYPLPEDEQQVR